jgi:protein O-GlcNAc transferase
VTGPELSVVIPTYRRAQSLKRCLDSVLAFPGPEIEVLVSDNASPDETQEVLQSFKDDQRLRFWRNLENVGAERNILKLWQEAKGQWILCLSDDDYLYPGALEKISSALKENPEVGVLMSDLQVIDPEGKATYVYSFNEETKFPAGLPALERMVWAAHIFTRIVLRRQWMDLAGTERHLDSMYPQMFAVGSILKEHPGLHLKQVLMAHTDGNPIHWQYQPDRMVARRIALVKDLLPGARWERERKTLVNQLVYEVATQAHEHVWREGVWFQRQREYLKIREVRNSFHYWRRVLKFLLLQAPFLRK